MLRRAAGLAAPAAATASAPMLSAGSPVSESYDPATKVWTLRYRVNGVDAPTRVALPPSVYPFGASIAVTGAPRADIDLRQPSKTWYGLADISLPDAKPGTVATVTISPA
ncbi:hypothetical protein ABIA32_002244 [Streptacidiphilus sp. MAP12-20]|uniref:hypothetical protein n=1 Tax=Streptacidiphilus sp. MAP12-20 TaxID=3156299 RepID=UPI003511F363